MSAEHCHRDDHELMREILQARGRAHMKHGPNGIEVKPADDPLFWLSCLGEEFGEVARALTYDGPTAGLRSELIDVMAVASAWIDALDGGARHGMAYAPAWTREGAD